MSVSMNKALKLISQNIIAINDTELIDIEDSSFRICAKSYIATLPLPRFDNSAMDGYAILKEDIGKELEVVGKIFAGDDKNIILQKGCTVKIMTGAKIPENAYAIVPQENTTSLNNNTISLSNDIKQYQHIRFIGEDIKNDELLVSKNQEINYSIISLLASQGIAQVEVYRKPRIAVFGSGEELRPHYEKIQSHQIYNSNSPTLVSRCRELNCESTFIGSSRDNLEDLKEHIKKSLDYDLVITSGGVSVGEADFTKEAFESFGMEYIFDGIIVKPGKPTVFGKIGNTFVLNLPGNPLASQIIFELFGKIIIQYLKNSNKIYFQSIKARISQFLQNKKGRPTIVVGYFDGEFFTPAKKRSPGMVNVLSHCNGMIILDEDVDILKDCSEIRVLLLNADFMCDKKKDLLTYAK